MQKALDNSAEMLVSWIRINPCLSPAMVSLFTSRLMINPYAPPGTQADSHQSVKSLRKPWSDFAILVLGVLVPGLPSLMMRRSVAGMVRFLILLLIIPASFALFGPFWGEVLFAGTQYVEAGFYPFVATCCITPVLSVWLGFSERRRLMAAIEPTHRQHADA
jgi:hypothetical protein